MCSLCQCNPPQHLIGKDHQPLISSDPRFRQQEIRPRRQRHLRCDASRHIRLIRRPPQTAPDPLALAIQHGINTLIDPAQIGHFDLHVVDRVCVREIPNVRQCIAPFVGDDPDIDALPL
ncbi:hypothetical protein KXW96_001642 [Aspergillus fumigatus]|nr:hypothetical protein KXW96_001642 [Aspergillus fumigatus]